MTADPLRRLPLGPLVLCLVPVTPPRLWRIATVEGEHGAAQLLRPGVVLTQADLAAAVAGRIDLVVLAAHALAALREEGR